MKTNLISKKTKAAKKQINVAAWAESSFRVGLTAPKKSFVWNSETTVLALQNAA
jgi:hypothetical protein